MNMNIFRFHNIWVYIWCHLILISWCENFSWRVHLQNNIDVCIHIMIVKKNIYFEIYFSLFFFLYLWWVPCTVNVVVFCKCDYKCNVLLPDMATLYTLSRLTLPPMAGPVSNPYVSVMRGSLEHYYLVE